MSQQFPNSCPVDMEDTFDKVAQHVVRNVPAKDVEENDEEEMEVEQSGGIFGTPPDLLGDDPSEKTKMKKKDDNKETLEDLLNTDDAESVGVKKRVSWRAKLCDTSITDAMKKDLLKKKTMQERGTVCEDRRISLLAGERSSWPWVT